MSWLHAVLPLPFIVAREHAEARSEYDLREVAAGRALDPRVGRRRARFRGEQIRTVGQRAGNESGAVERVRRKRRGIELRILDRVVARRPESQPAEQTRRGSDCARASMSITDDSSLAVWARCRNRSGGDRVPTCTWPSSRAWRDRERSRFAAATAASSWSRTTWKYACITSNVMRCRACSSENPAASLKNDDALRYARSRKPLKMFSAVET